MKKLLFLLVFIFFALLLYVGISTWSVPNLQLAEKHAPRSKEWPGALEALEILVGEKTVSQTGLDQDSAAFLRFWAAVDSLYPELLSKVEFRTGFSRLYKIEGGQQPGLLFAAHIDVVPPGSDWITNPFELTASPDGVSGRGVLDDKGSVVALLHAFRHLVVEGKKPKGDLYLALGHDEELGGYHGSAKMAEFLKGRPLEMVLDEGGYVVHGMVPGTSAPVALVGTAEKGEATYRLIAKGPGGHSSMPDANNPALRLSGALALLKPDFFQADLNEPLIDFMRYLGPEMNLKERIAFGNPALLKSVLVSIFTQSASGSALVRTTVAPTVVQVGNKENSMPVEAEAWVNVRMVPGHAAEQVKSALEEVVGPFGVEVSYLYPPVEASVVSSSRSSSFLLLQQAVSHEFPEALVAPYLMVAQSDGRHYQGLAKGVYRFLPFDLTEEELQGIHGSNERIAHGALNKAINFYLQLIVLWENQD